MSLSKKPYKGTRDFFPKEKRRLDFIFDQMKKSSEKFAYEPYDGPILEETDLYRAKSGEELINEQIYNFTDRGGRDVTIRPEMTPTVARMVSQVHKETPKPIRWYSIPQVMRYEKPQRGRLREHYQFNLDIFGAPSGLGELEVIQVITDIFTSFGADSSMFNILLNDRHVVDAFFTKNLKLDASEHYKLYKIIDKSKKVSSEVLDKLISEVLQGEKKDLFNRYLSLNSFEELFKFSKEVEITDNIEDLKVFYNRISKLGIEKFIKYDPTIVRGLDYYTGIVFEVFDLHPDNRRAICGGGAYANLLKIFNEQPLPGVGVGMGDVTLTDFLVTHNLIKDFNYSNSDIFVTYQTEDAEEMAIKLASDLRKKNINVELNFGSLKIKKLFSLAEKKGHKYATIIGTEEFEKGSIQIKNLENRDAETFNISEIDKIIKFIK